MRIARKENGNKREKLSTSIYYMGRPVTPPPAPSFHVWKKAMENIILK